MIANSKYLRRIGFNNTLITYNDKHKWPSKNQINRAFRWLQNKKTNDNLIISENLKIDLNESEKFISSGEFLFAAENYDRILKSYSSFPSLDSVKNKYENLIRSQKYKVEYRSLQNALKEEVKIFDKLFAKLQKDFSSPEKANLVNLYQSSSKQIDLSNKIQNLIYLK